MIDRADLVDIKQTTFAAMIGDSAITQAAQVIEFQGSFCRSECGLQSTSTLEVDLDSGQDQSISLLVTM